jgi:hypothetical protein
MPRDSFLRDQSISFENPLFHSHKDTKPLLHSADADDSHQAKRVKCEETLASPQPQVEEMKINLIKSINQPSTLQCSELISWEAPPVSDNDLPQAFDLAMVAQDPIVHERMVDWLSCKDPVYVMEASDDAFCDNDQSADGIIESLDCPNDPSTVIMAYIPIDVMMLLQDDEVLGTIMLRSPTEFERMIQRAWSTIYLRKV